MIEIFRLRRISNGFAETTATGTLMTGESPQGTIRRRSTPFCEILELPREDSGLHRVESAVHSLHLLTKLSHEVTVHGVATRENKGFSAPWMSNSGLNEGDTPKKTRFLACEGRFCPVNGYSTVCFAVPQFACRRRTFQFFS